MKRITLSQVTNFVMFMYILSLYLFTFRAEWTLVSNSLALILMCLIWVEIIISQKKIVFNTFLFIYLLFIIVCIISVFYAIDPNTAVTKVITMILIYILMLSLINYMDSYQKVFFLMKCFVFSGFIASIYILINADFSVLNRFGGELGNENAIGIIIGISSIFCLFYLLKNRNYWYLIIILTNLVVVLLTGSRKALILVVLSMAIVLIFKESGNLKSKLKSILVSIILIGIVILVINNVAIFYEIIGRRMVNMFQFILGEGTSEGSINTRTDMIKWGWEWFKERPLFGYGIDNYKYLYGYINSEGDVYSHNNVIELMVGTGIVGTALFYIANIVVIKDLLKASKLTSKLLCYSFIAIIAGYIFMSVGLIYYYGKHISIILAVGSIIYRLSKTELKKS